MLCNLSLLKTKIFFYSLNALLFLRGYWKHYHKKMLKQKKNPNKKKINQIVLKIRSRNNPTYFYYFYFF